MTCLRCGGGIRHHEGIDGRARCGVVVREGSRHAADATSDPAAVTCPQCAPHPSAQIERLRLQRRRLRQVIDGWIGAVERGEPVSLEQMRAARTAALDEIAAEYAAQKETT